MVGLKPLEWQKGIVEQITDETYRVKTFTIRLPEWQHFRSGQHYDVRLSAPDEYQALRSYSIGSAPETEGVIDLTIEIIDEGEVSPFFHEVVQQGDEIEIRGPIGGPFTWSKNVGGPLLLVAGGSGIVPLMSMVRHRQNADDDVQALLLYSARTADDIIYRQELEQRVEDEPNLQALYTLTRYQPSDWQGYTRRIDRDILRDALGGLDGVPHTYICGPTAFVEAIADGLTALGVPAEKIRTERFGPSGT